jgi:hypothetical protein
VNRKPPYYTLDQETRRFAELVAYYAESMANCQQNPRTKQDMLEVVSVVCERLGLTIGPDSDDLKLQGDVVLFPKFRLVRNEPLEEPTNSE